jgi:Fe2+ transport system protein FeoA
MIRLTELQLGVERRVVDVTAEPVLRSRLLEMGLAPDSMIMAVRALPFSGPLIVQSGVLTVALRFDEAQQIWVEG